MDNNMQNDYYQNNGTYQTPPTQKKLLEADRNWALTALLGIATCGIYYIVVFTMMGCEINQTASPRDGKKTMNYCLATLLLGPLTCGIFPLIWFHNFSDRVGREARLRGVDTNFGAASFWLWYVLGSFIIVGPFVYLYKLCVAMNGINESYNRCGR
ncbi:MAG: DUF4234 domain-containing protein [Lachnospiraceae bacterium]|nr:DUF4234 domain-containing protein [Lachnospiraceae bacterium]